MAETNGAVTPDPEKELRQKLEDLDRELAQVELADIVRLKKPYLTRPGGKEVAYTHGIVAEILTVLPDGRTRNVSLHLYVPASGRLYMGPNKIPEYVDFHTSEIELYKRATDEGYLSVVQ